MKNAFLFGASMLAVAAASTASAADMYGATGSYNVTDKNSLSDRFTFSNDLNDSAVGGLQAYDGRDVHDVGVSGDHAQGMLVNALA